MSSTFCAAAVNEEKEKQCDTHRSAVNSEGFFFSTSESHHNCHVKYHVKFYVKCFIILYNKILNNSNFSLF